MSVDKSKCDKELGARVHEHLISVGLETPTTEILTSVSSDEKIRSIEENVRSIMTTLGMDLTDDSLCETPKRVAKMYVNELFWGLLYDNFPKCTAIDNKMNYHDSFVLEKGIKVMSACEHHLVTIDGRCTCAYIPKNKVLGLSKLNRIVEFFSRRPQVQERLCEQIAETISFVTGSPDVAVYIDGEHYCVKSRGVSDQGSSTVTLAVRGRFAEDNDVRREFLAIARE